MPWKQLTILVLLPWLGACSEDEGLKEGGAEQRLPSHFRMLEPPAEVRDILGLAERVAPGDTVVLRGRVRNAPLGRCLLRLVDLSLPPCHEVPGSDCTTPWDWCSIDAERLKLATVHVVFRDGDGVIKGTVRGFDGLDTFSEVVVQGTVEKDRSGGLVIEASALRVQPR